MIDVYKSNSVNRRGPPIDINKHLSYGMSPQRSLNRNISSDSRDLMPINHTLTKKSNSPMEFRQDQDRKNSTIWDAIVTRDYEKFKKEEDAKVVKKKEEQESMRNFLEKQVKGVEFRK